MIRPALPIVDDRSRLGWGLEGIVGPVIVFVGLALNCAGLALGAWKTRLYVRVGERTPHLDPQRRLMIDGPYRSSLRR